MKIDLKIIPFVLISIIHLVLEGMGSPWVQISKPLLMPVLAFAFYSSTLKENASIAHAILLSLFLSFLGDVFLLKSQSSTTFFLLGLGSFLLAHLSYIRIFSKLHWGSTMRIDSKYLVGLILYLLIFLALTWQGLDLMLKIAVPVYALILLGMLYGSLSLWLRNKESQNTKYILIGAILFVLSDSLIGMSRFSGLALPEWVYRLGIMCTYILAQYLIVRGISGFIKATNLSAEQQN